MDLYKLEVTLLDRNKKLQVNLDNLTNLRLNEENLKDENFNESTKENINSSLFNENEELLLNYGNLYLNNNILENISIKDEGKFPEINSIERSTEKQENSKNFKNLKDIFDHLKNNQEILKLKNIIIKELNDSDEFFIEFIHTVLFLHLHEFSSILDMPDIFYEGANKKKEFLAKLFLDTEEGLYNKLKTGDYNLKDPLIENYRDSLIEFESTLKYFRTKVDPWMKTDVITGGTPGDTANKTERWRRLAKDVIMSANVVKKIDSKTYYYTFYDIYNIYKNYKDDIPNQTTTTEILSKGKSLVIEEKKDYGLCIQILAMIIERYNKFFNQNISEYFEDIKKNSIEIKNDIAILEKILGDNQIEFRRQRKSKGEKTNEIFKTDIRSNIEKNDKKTFDIFESKIETEFKKENTIEKLIEKLLLNFKILDTQYDKKISQKREKDIAKKAVFETVVLNDEREDLIEIDKEILYFRNIIELFLFIIYRNYINYLDTVMNKFIKFREKVKGSSVAKLNTTNYLYTKEEIEKSKISQEKSKDKSFSSVNIKNSILNSIITYRTYVINLLKFFKREYDLKEIKKDINRIFKIESGNIQTYYKNFLNTEESKKKQKYIFTKIVEDRNREDTHYDRSKYRLNTESGFDQIIREYYKYLYKDKQVKDLRNVEKINIITLYNVLFILKEIYLKDNTILILPVNDVNEKFFIKNIDIDFTNKETSFFKVDNNSKKIKILLKFDSEIISEFSTLEIFHYFEDIEELEKENIKTSINSFKPEDVNNNYKKYREIFITDQLKLNDINFKKFSKRSDIVNEISSPEEVFFNKKVFLLLNNIYNPKSNKTDQKDINVELLNENKII